MISSGFKEGAVYAEIQMARILVKRGALDAAIDMSARVREEFNTLGQATSALESALVQSLAMIKADRAGEALELLDRSVTAAGKDAQIFDPQVAEVRARALAALGRISEAEREIKAGLRTSRDLALPYEEGMLLHTRIEIARLAGREPAPSDLADSKRILGGLGIDITPWPPESVS